MLNRQLFYTAVTRAKKKLYIVGNNAAILYAIKTLPKKRYDLLCERLKENEK